MVFYLLDHPNPRAKQYREGRRNGDSNSGVVVIHTAENLTDALGPDAGAEGVAAFISSRATFGSYHCICDSDSTVPMVPWEMEAWQDTRTNTHGVGISGAVRCADWPRLGARGDAIVVRMAQAAADYREWLAQRTGGRIIIPARRITRAEALARVPGFIGHGEIDPGRRSDPGPFNWGLFLDTFATATGATTTTDSGVPTTYPTEDDEMVKFIARLKGKPQVYIGDLNTRRHIASERELADIRYQAPRAGIRLVEMGEVANLDWMGVDVTGLVRS